MDCDVVVKGVPARCDIDEYECLSSWRLTLGSPDFFTWYANAEETRSGSHGVPSGSQKTRSGSPDKPS